MAEILFYSALVMTASLAGVFTVWKSAGRVIASNLDFLVSFSAGVFAVVSYHLGVEALELSASYGYGLFWVIIGALVIWLVFSLLPATHHHHGGGEEEPHSRLDARRIIVSDAIHNVGDGILLAASFTANFTLGALAALSIFVHEMVQEISEFFVMKEAGYSTRKALLVNFGVSATILVGAVGGYYLLENFEEIEAPILGFASGAFLIVVLHDLIPHSIRSLRKETIVSHIIWFATGIALMYLLTNLVGH